MPVPWQIAALGLTLVLLFLGVDAYVEMLAEMRSPLQPGHIGTLTGVAPLLGV